MTSVFFKSSKKTEETKFSGQASDVDLKKALDITKRTTGESPTGAKKSEGILSVSTESHYVDFYPKTDCDAIIREMNK